MEQLTCNQQKNTSNVIEWFENITSKQNCTFIQFDIIGENLYSSKKKSTDSCFDVTMGSYDGAEICELVGTYILFKLENAISKDHIALCPDDGLINSFKRP